MIFSPYEALQILKRSTKLSRDDIHAKGGPCPRVQQRILNENPAYKIKNETALTNILIEQGLIPVDSAWQHPLAHIRELHDREDLAGLSKTYSALYKLAESHIENNSNNISREFRIGAMLFAAYYLMPFVKPKNSAYTNGRKDALQKASKFFDMAINELENDNSACSIILKAKCSGNIVVMEWNSRSMAERNTDEMRSILNKTGYIEWIVKQIEIFPHIDTHAFNGLCIASHLRWRELYEPLHAALVIANPNYAAHPEFSDDDFVDFREWLGARELEQEQEKDEGDLQ